MQIANLLIELKELQKLQTNKTGTGYILDDEFVEFLKNFKEIETIVKTLKADLSLAIEKTFSEVDEKCGKIEGNDKVNIYKRPVNSTVIVDEEKAKPFLKYTPDTTKINEFKKEHKTLPEGLEIQTKSISYGYKA